MVSLLKMAKNVDFEKNVLSIFSKTVKMVFDNFDLSIFSKTVKMVFDKFEKISRPHKNLKKKSDCKKREQALLTLKNGVPDLMQPETQLPEYCMHKLIDNMQKIT